MQPRDKVIRDVRVFIFNASGAQRDLIIGGGPREEVTKVVLNLTFGAV